MIITGQHLPMGLCKSCDHTNAATPSLGLLQQSHQIEVSSGLVAELVLQIARRRGQLKPLKYLELYNYCNY
jgi:hypothetical protein